MHTGSGADAPALLSEATVSLMSHCRLPALIRAVLPAAVLASAVALGGPAPAQAITIGVAEQQPSFTTSTAFERTRIGHVRIFVGWDAIGSDWQRAELDAWFAAVRAAGLTPPVTIAKSPLEPDVPPTPDRDPAPIHDEHLVGEGLGFVHVMGGQHHGAALALHLAHHVP